MIERNLALLLAGVATFLVGIGLVYLLILKIIEIRGEIRAEKEQHEIELKRKKIEEGLIDVTKFRLNVHCDPFSGEQDKYVYLNKYVFSKEDFKFFIDKSFEDYLIGSERKYKMSKKVMENKIAYLEKMTNDLQLGLNLLSSEQQQVREKGSRLISKVWAKLLQEKQELSKNIEELENVSH